MLTVLECIQQRRSIRSFRSDPVPDEAIHQMLEAARLAPSGSNRQPWRFIVVTDAEERAGVSKICFNQAFIAQAPLVFICCADFTAYSRASERERYQELVEYGVTETMSGRFASKEYWAERLAKPEADLRAIRGPAVANTNIAVEHIVLMAASLGLGSCWVGAVGEGREIEEFFNLPATMSVVAVLPVGYPAKVPPPRPRLSLPQILLRPLPAPVR